MEYLFVYASGLHSTFCITCTGMGQVFRFARGGQCNIVQVRMLHRTCVQFWTDTLRSVPPVTWRKTARCGHCESVRAAPW